MEGKLFYGKTTSPKVIAEASLAYSFSFDLQRFDDPIWSIGADGGDHAGKYIFGNGTASVASLFADNATNYVWSLSGGSGSSSTVTLDLSLDANKATSGSITGGDINTSINSSSINSLTASDLAASFHFKLASNTALVSILGSNQGDSIDASAVTNRNLSITGGSGNDTLIAGTSGTFYLDGGEGDDSLVGGGGKDYFIYDGKGADSVFGYGSGDVISLAAFPGVASVGTNDNALVISVDGSSLNVAKYGNDTTVVTVVSGENTYYYNKNYIRTAPSTSTATFSLTSAAVSLDASSYSAVSIDGTAATGESGLKIFGTSGNDSIIGSNSDGHGTSIYGNGGNDFVSLNGSSVDIFVYNGKGSASIEGLGSSGFVSLSAKNAALIRDGSALESINGGHAGKDFKLTFGTNNALTFINSASASIKVGNNALIYTPTAISIKGAESNGDSITLGSSYVNETGKFEGTGYSVISAAAVSVSNESGDYFAVSGGHTSNLIWGSDRQVTSILGGTDADTLYAGTKGASLVGNGGGDLLVGDTARAATDYFIYDNGGKPTIRNYTYGTDVVSVSGTAVPTTDITKINLESGTSNFHISLGASGDSVLTFESSTKVDIVSLGANGNNDTYHYENDRIIVNTDRITLGPAYTTRNFNVNSTAFEGYALSSIDASAVTVANGINITAYAGASSTHNSVIGSKYAGKIVGSEYSDYLQSGVTATSSLTTTIDAGEAGTTANDTLVGGEGNDWFIYRGAQASIGSYTSGKDSIQIVGFNMLGDDVPTFASLSNDEENSDLVLTFGTGSSLSIAGGATSGSVVTFRNNSHTFEYSAGAVSLDNKSVTLTAEYDPAHDYIATGTIATVNAEAVSTTGGIVSLGANATLGTRLIGSSTLGNSLVSGAKNDYFIGGNAADVFEYTAGKDTVSNYTYSQNDSLVADSFIDNIKSGKVSGTKLIFTGTDKKNVLTFLSEDNAVEKVSIGGADHAGHLTKDGHVKTGENSDSLKLFSSARGEIELSAAPYSVTGAHDITTVNAADVAQSITLIPGSLSSAATYILPGNKRRDRFEYDKRLRDRQRPTQPRHRHN